MLAAEIAYQAISNLFTKFAKEQFPTSENQDELADAFYRFAYPKMKEAVKKTELSCNHAEEPNKTCPVFPGELQSLGAVLSIYSSSIYCNQTVRIGFWEQRVEHGQQAKYGHITRWSKVEFGPDLFSDEERKESVDIPTSHCSPTCKDGEEMWTAKHEASCCHSCQSCGSKAVSNGTRCQKCLTGFRPNKTKTYCTPLPIVDRTLTSPQRYVLLTLCLAFLLVLLGTLALYVRFWNMRVVRASDRILMILFLIAIIVCLLLETLVLIFGEGPFCKYMHLVSSVSLLGTVVVISVKTGRMARIHCASRKMRLARGDWTMTTPTQILCLCAILGLFALGEAVGIWLNPPLRKKFHKETFSYQVCIADYTGAVVTDLVTEIVIFVTGVMAFFTRKLMNVTFAQANHLFMSTLLLNTLWPTVRTAYYLAEEIHRPLLGPMFVLFHTFILWSWPVAPVLHIALHKPQGRRRSLLRSIRFSSKFTTSSHPSSQGRRSQHQSPVQYLPD